MPLLGGGVVKAGTSAEAAELHECFSKLVQLQEQLKERQLNEKNIAEKEREQDELLSFVNTPFLHHGVDDQLAETLATTVCAPTNANGRNATVWLSSSSSSVGSIRFKGCPSTTSSTDNSITLSPLDDSVQFLLPCIEKQIERLDNDIDRLERRNSELPDSLSIDIYNVKARLEMLQEVVNDQVNAKLREDKDNQSFNKVDRAITTTSSVDVSTVDLVQETADKKIHKVTKIPQHAAPSYRFDQDQLGALRFMKLNYARSNNEEERKEKLLTLLNTACIMLDCPDDIDMDRLRIQLLSSNLEKSLKPPTHQQPSPPPSLPQESAKVELVDNEISEQMQDVQDQESAPLSPHAPAQPHGVMFFLFFLFSCIGSNLLLPIRYIGKSNIMQVVNFAIEVASFLLFPVPSITVELTESDVMTDEVIEVKRSSSRLRVYALQYSPGSCSSGKDRRIHTRCCDSRRRGIPSYWRRPNQRGLKGDKRIGQRRVKVCSTGRSNKKASNRLCPGRRGWAISSNCRRKTRLDDIRRQRERRQRQDTPDASSDTSPKSQADTSVLEFSRRVVAPYLTHQLGSNVRLKWEEECSGGPCEWEGPQPVYDPWSSTNEIYGLDSSDEEESSSKSLYKHHQIGGGKLKTKKRKTSHLPPSQATQIPSHQHNSDFIRVNGDVLERMTPDDLYAQTYKLLRGASIETVDCIAAQSIVACSSIAMNTAARHAVYNIFPVKNEHVGIALGQQMYREIINGQRMHVGEYLCLPKSEAFLENVCSERGVEIDSIEAQNLFDRESRRALLDKLTADKRVGIAIMFQGHAFNILNHPTKGYVLMDSLPAHHHNKAFYWVCKDIDTLEVALLNHVVDRLSDVANVTMSPWFVNVDAGGDCRTFSAYIFACQSRADCNAHAFDKAVKQSIQLSVDKRHRLASLMGCAVKIMEEMISVCKSNSTNASVSLAAMKKYFGETDASFILSQEMKKANIHNDTDKYLVLEQEGGFIMTADDCINVRHTINRMESDIALLETGKSEVEHSTLDNFITSCRHVKKIVCNTNVEPLRAEWVMLDDEPQGDDESLSEDIFDEGDNGGAKQAVKADSESSVDNSELSDEEDTPLVKKSRQEATSSSSNTAKKRGRHTTTSPKKTKKRREMKSKTKAKKVTTSYKSDTPVPANPFDSLESLLPQALASKDMYKTAIDVRNGKYTKLKKGSPILKLMQDNGLGLVVSDEYSDVASLQAAIRKYRRQLEKAMIKAGGNKNKLKGWINFGDEPSADASGSYWLNYPTVDEVEQPQQGRGSCNLMNREHSACIRFPVQTFPRMMVNNDRKRRGELYVKQTFTCDSLLMMDLCCVAFTPANKSDNAYYKAIDTIIKTLGLTRSQFFLINYIFYLLQLKLYHMKNDSKPFPFMSASKMTHLHWLGNVGATTTKLVQYCGNVWHPEAYWRHFTAAMPDEMVDEQNTVFGTFFPHVAEVDITIENGLKTKVVYAWDSDITDDMREEMRQAKFRANQKGGKATGKLCQDAAFLYHIAKADGASEEEALELVRTELSEEHFSRYKGSKKGGKIGGKTSGKMVQDAAFNFRKAKAKGCDLEDALECVRDLLSDAHYNMYRCHLKFGTTASVASAFEKAFNELLVTDKRIKELVESSDDDIDAFSPLVTEHVFTKLGEEHVGKYNWLLRQYENNHDSVLDSLRKVANEGLLGYHKTATKQQKSDRAQKAANTVKRKGTKYKKKVSENQSKAQTERNGNTGDMIDWVCPCGHTKRAPYPTNAGRQLSCLECENKKKKESTKRIRVYYPVHNPNRKGQIWKGTDGKTVPDPEAGATRQCSICGGKKGKVNFMATEWKKGDGDRVCRQLKCKKQAKERND